MATIPEMLAIAVQHHQGGRLQAAEQIYRQILALQPNHADAMHLLGVIASQMGRPDDALACWRRAVELKPDFAPAHYNLGLALEDQGKLDEALACWRRAVELKPDFAEAHYNLGVAFTDQGKLDEALACWRRTVELKPDFAQAHYKLGNVMKDRGRLDEAVACYRRALELKPDFAETHGNLGNALRDQGKLDEALACFRRALELKPDDAETHNNLGNVLKDQGKLDEALACFRRALELSPDYAEAHGNLGVAMKELGRLDEALACCRRAVELKPDLAEAHVNLAFVCLLAGDWQHGWPQYEWRWQTKGFTPRRFPQPLWDGESLAGKTILLHAEQGLGDTIQFIRYAPIVKRHGGTVILECQKPLVGLLESCPGIDQLIGQGSDLPAFDVHAPLLSLPGILKTSLETVPARIPYLHPQAEIFQRWQKRLIELDGFKIGIGWQGNPTYPGDRWRSMALRCFAPLAQIPGVRLMSLQKGAGAEQLAEVRNLFSVMDLAAELDQESGPFMDTAAVMKNLDLVITSDTTAAHLGGALGAAVWVALPFAPDWRWLLDRSDSPWYPTMRLFRQRERGNWQGVFEDIRKALCERIESRGKAGDFHGA